MKQMRLNYPYFYTLCFILCDVKRAKSMERKLTVNLNYISIGWMDGMQLFPWKKGIIDEIHHKLSTETLLHKLYKKLLSIMTFVFKIQLKSARLTHHY